SSAPRFGELVERARPTLNRFSDFRPAPRLEMVFGAEEVGERAEVPKRVLLDPARLGEPPALLSPPRHPAPIDPNLDLATAVAAREVDAGPAPQRGRDAGGCRGAR